MTKKIVTAAFLMATVTCLSARAAQALPIQLSQPEFAAATVGLTTITETFEQYRGYTSPGNPFTFANGTYSTTGTSPYISGPSVLCPFNSVCLAALHPIGERTFSALPTGTTLWGSDFQAYNDTGDFLLKVIGNSGTQSFRLGGTTSFIGVSDALGLLSISIQTFAGANYGFDNIVTAGAPAPPAVPEPATLSLLALGLVCGGARRWMRQPAA